MSDKDSKPRLRLCSNNSNSNINNTDNDDNRISIELNDGKNEKKKEIVYGRTPYNTVFKVPHTIEMMKSLFDPNYKKSLFDYITFSVIGLQLLLFLVLPLSTKKWIFFFLFVFWRGAYNMGLGWLLKYQSDKHGLVIWAKRNKIFDKSNLKWYSLLKKELSAKMGDDYDFDKVPLEFNTWLLFRQLVDLILLNDFTSYICFALSNFSIPENSGIFMNLLRWIGGGFLLWFNVWVKTDAHRVVKDFAWYWGDFFFLIDQSLTFDGVFEMAPHPMYSVGYIGYYGISMITASYTVLFVSLAAHAAQFSFLTIVENPHIDKTYNPPTPLNAKLSKPLLAEKYEPATTVSDEDVTTFLPSFPLSSPSSISSFSDRYIQPMLPDHSDSSSHCHFRRDLIIFKNFDLFRSNDLFVIFTIFYAVIVPLFMAGTTDNVIKSFLVLQCLVWRIFHSYVLGYILHLQSKSKFLTKHYVKFGGTAEEAFSNWKSIYNLSLCMTYVTFIAVAWKMYYFPVDWTYGLVLLRHTLCVLLIALHIWTSISVFEVLGDFGWFYGDFFMDDYSTNLYYTGIYRFVNNPEKIMGHAAFWGITLAANSWLICGIALFSQISNLLFLRYVESPHMKKLYGDKIRKEAGITKTIKRLTIIPNTIIRENAEIQIVQEVIGKFAENVEKVVEEAAGVLGPRLKEVVGEARSILQNYRDNLLSQAVSQIRNHDVLKNHDVSKYSIVLVTPEDSIDITPPNTPTSPSHDKAGPEQFEIVSKSIMFTLGSPIHLKWTAPKNHARKDWIGIYKVTSNPSKSVTSVSSRGRYMYVLPEDEDFNGIHDFNSGYAEKTHATSDDFNTFGDLWFKGDQLPWEVGTYEFRYHHDNNHTVMTISQPFEIKAPIPKYILDLSSIEQMVLNLVQKALDGDPKLIPRFAQDNYVLMKEIHAKRIVYGIKMIFSVDFAWEIVAIDGNVGILARRIYKANHVLKPIDDYVNTRSRSSSDSSTNNENNNIESTNSKFISQNSVPSS